ncbi:MAG: hypothetical protein PW786_08915 [Arachidicoccus sp.]|nr:hypothetical protein [Arachidicoccus sp.]
MEQQSYKSLIEQLVEKYRELDMNNDNGRTKQFHIVSANLHHYLSAIAYNRHEEIFKKILMYQKLSIVEQDSIYALDNADIENFSLQTIKQLKNYPSIICTFHLGSYRLINLLLVKQHVPFSLVISKKTVDTQGDTFKALYHQFGDNEDENDFKLIDAETPSAVLQMFRELKKGKSLVIYIDGNTGAGKNSKLNENCWYIDFLNQQLAARTGIGFLSYAANVPVLPVISYRPCMERITLRFFDMIFPDLKTDRNVYSRNLTQQLYDIAAPFIQEYPEQWEAWLYLHKVARVIKPLQVNTDTGALVSAGMIRFNSAYFGLFKTEEKYYLFDKSDYMSYLIPNDIYILLRQAALNPVDKQGFPVNLLPEFFQRKVLITAYNETPCSVGK